jgi:hypothetical protein
MECLVGVTARDQQFSDTSFHLAGLSDLIPRKVDGLRNEAREASSFECATRTEALVDITGAMSDASLEILRHSCSHPRSSIRFA